MTEVRVYTFPEAVRRRPGMYFELGSGAITHVVNELVSNSIDAFLCGHCTLVSVSVNGAEIEVADDGDGIPFEQLTEQGESLGSQYLIRLHNSRSADEHAPHIHLHQRNGIGLAAIMAGAKELVCRSWRSGQLWEQCFANGIALSKATVVAQGAGRGTVIRLVADLGLLESTGPNLSQIRAELWRAAHLFPGIAIDFHGERYRSKRGLIDLAHTRVAMTACMRNSWGGREPFHLQASNELISVDAVALGLSETESAWQSWVNGCETVLHGTHRLGFETLLKDKQWTPALAMIHVVANEPRYAGPTKDRMVEPAIGDAVAELLREPLRRYCMENGISK